ncbi:MAG: tRNA 2-selenouridine(34) synthase MnmH [Bacteroidetes bacterium]|nr:tRNA 2-selenouridine(34) synthase MnmH [Bacteroidota bacterium]
MIPEIRTDKELFEFIQNARIDESISLKDIFSKYLFEQINIDDLLKKIRSENTLLIDARSEKEFNESSLPFAKNFPVLNNLERHNVGLLYRKYSQSAAVWLATEYANPKSVSLQKFLTDNEANKKDVIVFCWRGGGRSKYLSKMISDLGYNVKFLSGGQKAYRKRVNDFFSNQNQKYNLLELRGMTGSGKTELLNALKNDLPVIDLEFAAKHYSSLFGNIPYDINNFPRVKNQSAFENSLFEQFAKYDLESPPLFLIESESKRVGDFEIPAPLYRAIEETPCIQINSSFENRIRRIVKDYFGEDNRGLEPMKKIFADREKFFKAQLSTEVYGRLLDYLEKGEVSKFTDEMMEKYYDKRYKVKPKEPIAEISSDNIREAKSQVIEIYKKL